MLSSLRVFLMWVCLSVAVFASVSAQLTPTIDAWERFPTATLANTPTDTDAASFVELAVPRRDHPPQSEWQQWLQAWHTPQWLHHVLPISAQPHEEGDTQHRGDGSKPQLALMPTQRFMTFYMGSDEGLPDYQLVFEFPILIALCLMVGYRVHLSPVLDWMLKTHSPSSRISGWKESNLIYAHSARTHATA